MTPAGGGLALVSPGHYPAGEQSRLHGQLGHVIDMQRNPVNFLGGVPTGLLIGSRKPLFIEPEIASNETA
jgi:hypothetical protein